MSKKEPQWGYRWENGAVVSKLFPEGRPPRGWADSPAAVKKPKKRDADDA